MSATVLRESLPTARKPRRCHVCWGLIGTGDTYYRQEVADQGTVGAWAAHLLCNAIFLRLWEPWWDEYDEPEQSDVASELVAVFAALVGSVPLTEGGEG